MAPATTKQIILGPRRHIVIAAGAEDAPVLHGEPRFQLCASEEGVLQLNVVGDGLRNAVELAQMVFVLACDRGLQVEFAGGPTKQAAIALLFIGVHRGCSHEEAVKQVEGLGLHVDAACPLTQEVTKYLWA